VRGQRRYEIRKPVDDVSDWAQEIDPALLGQAHESRRGEELGGRAYPEQVVRRHRLSGFRVRNAEALR
jgi:hypothetical protein